MGENGNVKLTASDTTSAAETRRAAKKEMSEELRAAILLLLDDRHRLDASLIVGDTEVAEFLSLELNDVQRQLDILEDQGLTRGENTFEGHGARISPKGIAAAEKLRAAPAPGKSLQLLPGRSGDSQLGLFISHSSHDQATAVALIDLMRSALGLQSTQIRCTSVDGYRLPVGANTDEQLRREVLDAKAFIGIVSRESIASAYVLFELGARWGASRSLAPVLAAGVSPRLLKGPLAGLNALRCDDENQLHQLVADIGAVLGIACQPVPVYRSALLKLVAVEPKLGDGADKAVEPSPPQTLTEAQEAVVRGIIARDEQYVATRELAQSLKWRWLPTQVIVDQLLGLGLLFASLSSRGVLYGLSVSGRSLALRLGLLG